MLLVTIFVCGKSGRGYADYDSEETTISTTQVCTTKTTTTENSTPTSDISTSKTTSSRTTISDEPTTSRRKDVETTKRTAQETTSKRTTTQTTKDTYINQYTEDDLYVLSHVIYGEAGDCSNEAQRAVGSVVLNRVASSEFPNTIRGVVFQPSQYACTWDGNYYREPSERAVNNAKYLLENGSTLPSYVVYQAQFVQGRGVYAEIDGEIFCY